MDKASTWWLAISVAVAGALLTVLLISEPNVFMVSDAIAQFLPISVHGARSVFAGEFPLFNFYQFLGHPVLEVGYYPVLYPLLWLSYGIALFFSEAGQQTWNILCVLQIVFNVVSVYLFLFVAVRVAPPLAAVGALSVGVCGMALLQGGEWFYSLVVYGFVPLLLLAFQRVRLAPVLSRVFAMVLIGVFFVFASNVQYLFYAAHFIGLFVVWDILLNRQLVPSWRRLAGYLILAGVLSLIMVGPYLVSVMSHARESIREVGNVSLDKYYWLTNDWMSLVQCSWWPCRGLEPHDLSRPLMANYWGLVPFIGFGLSPVALWFSKTRGMASFFHALAFCLVCTLFALLMSLGPRGGIAAFLYHVPPYGWFRHSIKWATFFQLFGVMAGVVSIEVCLRIFGVTWRRFCSYGAFGTTVVLLFTVSGLFKQPTRLTEVTLPLEKPAGIFDYRFRQVGLWHKGEYYKGDTPMSILGHNYSTFWQIPGFVGYEPQLLRTNYEALQHQFFPGYFLDAETIDVEHLMEFGVGYLRVPESLFAETEALLKGRYPGLIMRSHPAEGLEHSGVIELTGARPTVFGDSLSLEKISFQGNSVAAEVVAKAATEVTFNWIAHPAFRITVDGVKRRWHQDSRGRPVVKLKKPGRRALVLEYSPQGLTRGLAVGLCIGIGMMVYIIASYAGVFRARPRSVLF